MDDEVWFSALLREKFPEPEDLPEGDRRIDFLCVREGTNLVVVEIKRPGLKASIKHLDQIEEQVNFARDYISKTTDPELQYKTATGYLLCGNLVDTFNVRGKSVKGVDGQRKCPAKWPAKMSLVLLAMITDGSYSTRSRFTGGLRASMYFFAVSRWMPSSRATPRVDNPLRFAF